MSQEARGDQDAADQEVHAILHAVEPGKMDDHDLATRLAYFLTQGPPDATLIDLANRK